MSNAKRFQRGGWRGLWETTQWLAVRFARQETDTNAKRKHNRAKRNTSSIQARGALSKTNQVVTSNSMPNADPIKIDLL